MKTLLLAGAGFRLADRRKLLAGDGARAETLGREHVARHLPTRPPRRFDRCRGNPALRVAVRLRQTRGMEGSLGAGQVTGD